ncbi:MAG: SUMF1/EgtB/PvdO family nonheme iron enzyme [Rikenellaceae bacterium]
MKKIILTLMSYVLTLGCAFGQTLIDDLVASKKSFKENLIQHKTGVVRLNEPAEKLLVDVSGWNYLSLQSCGTADGVGYDHSAWGNVYLTRKDGVKVKVSEMEFSYANTHYGLPKRNEGFENKVITVNGKEYSNGISMHAEAEVIIALNGDYKTFEAEVGVEDSGKENSSIMFKVQNLSAQSLVNNLIDKYPMEMGTLISFGNLNAKNWMDNTDGEFEKKVAEKVVKNLANNKYYETKIAAATGSLKDKIDTYVSVILEVQKVSDLNSRLQFIDAANVRRAFNDMKTVKGYDTAKYEAKLKELESIDIKGIDLFSGDADIIAKAEKALSLSREILLSNKALDNDRIILGKYNLGSKSRSGGAPVLGTQNNNWTNQMSASTGGFDAEISEMTSIRESTPQFSTIYKPQSDAPVSDLMLHWDAVQILFTSVNDEGQWNIFKVGVDGADVEEVIKTDESDLVFMDGTFLPNGKYIANSNIGYHGVPCVHGTAPVANMVLYDPKDNSLRRLTFDQDANWHPVVANNGKVMYVRWEYTDLTHYYSRITMHMNPDGTEQKSLYGSGGFFPNSTFDIQPLPGNTSKFIGVISGHHGVARSGRLMLFDPAKSRDKLEGIAQEIPYSTRKIEPIIKDQLVNDVWPQFIKPRPVTDKYFLVTAKLTPQSLWGIYLVDIYDNMTLIAESEGEGYINAIYVQKRDTPPVIPDKVDLSKDESTVYIQDIYEGEGLPGVPRGTVKKLRVFAYEFGYINALSNHIAQGIQSGWDIKRLLGEVDVNEDGSAMFTIPANTPISLQPLDSLGQAMQWMRSWLTGMPGEVVSCVGCHEDQNMVAIPKTNIASKSTPQPIDYIEGGARSFTYKLEIQPILDRACVACHNEKSNLDFTGDKYDEGIPGDRFIIPAFPFMQSYLNIHPYVNRQGSEADALVMKPYEYHASTSELIRILRNGHHGVELKDSEWQTLYAWIDLNAPYNGAFIQKDLNGYNQIERRQELMCKYNNLDVDWQQELDDYAKVLESKGKIEPVMPDYVEPTYKPAKKVKTMDVATAKEQQSQLGDTRKEVDLGNGVKMVFRKIPAGQFIMGSNAYGKECVPESRVKIAKPFWIGEIEVTNEQYNAFVPEHDSRYIAQFWKDHVYPGYEANSPAQPVIRVSYNQVMEYCAKLSEHTGLNITLPTEAQWEWAARAGSTTDFWFGDTADFSKYENLADVQLENMAVAGVDPQPMGRDHKYFRYFNYLLKSEDVDDGAMIQRTGKGYESNAWGLYDMLGNVRELTRSDYVSYPYKESSVEGHDKVVRGGSWIDRAKNSTSYSRKSVASWQPSNNVGFRLIIEE